MRFKLTLSVLIIVLSFLQAMPPPPGRYNPLWHQYLKEKASLGIDAPINPVRDIGKKGVFNDRSLQPQLLISGTKKIPAVLICFSDYLPSYDTLEFQNMLFGTWPSGSARDYYREVSYNILNLTGKVDGWYLAAYNHSYYGYANGFQRAAILAKEAAQYADNYLDYSQFDNDADGYVDLFTVIHSGYGCEETGNGADIWSHQWSFSGAGIGEYVSADADPNHPGQYIKIDLYTIQPELSNYSNYGNMICIGVYVHEWGHGFGLPDLYDTDGGGSGLGNWCMMAGGSWGGDGNSPWYPSHLSAWAKRDLGWLAPTVVIKDSTYAIKQVEFNSQCYLLPTAPDVSEYFLIENRQRVGFDATLRGTGLCIYHIDDDVIAARRAENRVNAGGSYPYGVALEQADGQDHLWHGTNRGDAGDPYPGSTNNTAFDTLGTTPNSQTNDGVNSKCGVNQISNSASTMQARMYVAALGLSIPILQNPFLTQYMDIWVAPTRTLIATPKVWVKTGAESTAVTMSLVQNSQCYKGDYKLITEGEITVRVNAEGIDTSRVFTAWYLIDQGTIVSASKQFKIAIPMGILSKPTWFTVVEEKIQNESDESLSFGVSEQFIAGPDNYGFQNPVLLTISYKNTRVENPKKLGIYQKKGKDWLYLGGFLNQIDQTISILTNSTGSYQIRYNPLGPELQDISDLPLVVLPNPNSGTMLIMYNLAKTENVKLALYDVTGRLVEKLIDDRQAIGSHNVYWHDSKQQLKNGIYFLVLKTDSQQRSCKLIITR